ncbi:hypothetical protein Peur_025177 [Populus x canadensis]
MDLNWLSAILVGAGCLALGYCIGTRCPFIFLRLTPKVVKDTKTNPSSHHGNKKNKSKEPFEIDKLADILDDFKMVLVVRNDLKMGKGKIAAQCSHATLGLYKKILNRAPKALNRWEMCAQPKVVVKIESEEDMLVLQVNENPKKIADIKMNSTKIWKVRLLPLDILGNASQLNIQAHIGSKFLFFEERAKSLKLPTHITIDAGRTQIAPNSRTVMAILGKSFRSRPVEVVDDVTGGLKLL